MDPGERGHHRHRCDGQVCFLIEHHPVPRSTRSQSTPSRRGEGEQYRAREASGQAPTAANLAEFSSLQSEASRFSGPILYGVQRCYRPAWWRRGEL